MRTLVVGASSGLGRCIAVGLGRRGARVALLARREGRLAAAAREVGPDAVPISCDVSDEQSVKRSIEAAAAALGGIDALVYATGIGPLARLADVGAETWRRLFDTRVEDLVGVLDAVLRCGSSASVPVVAVTPRPPA